MQNTARAVLEALQKGAQGFAVGGAPGYDLLCGELLLSLKERYPQIRLLVYLPYRGFGESFSPADKKTSQKLLAAADEAVALAPHYFKGCMQLRNRRLVEDAALCIAYLRKPKSGTAQTVSLARQKGIEVILV